MITIYDDIMGSGKSSKIIKDINSDQGSSSFIIIVPTLPEIKRYVDDCSPYLVTPEYIRGKQTKKQHLRELLFQGISVVTTHAMFSLWEDKFNEFLITNNYKIIIDEETNCVVPFTIKPEVIVELKELELLHTDEKTKRLVWNIDKSGINYNTNPTHNEVKAMCLGYFVVENDKDTVVEFPSAFFKLPLEISIHTYMFEASYMAAYFKYNDIDYSIKHLLTDEEYLKKKEIIRDLIRVETPKTRSFINKGENSSYSHSYYEKLTKEEHRRFRNSLGSYMKRLGYNKEETLYACPKQYSVANKKDGLYSMPRGYKRLPTKSKSRRKTGSWIPFNEKATNDYCDNKNMVYMVNVYPNVGVYRYITSKLKNKGLPPIPQKDIALSVLLQCIWRMRIRKNESINVLILSNRMEEIFKKWLLKDTR